MNKTDKSMDSLSFSERHPKWNFLISLALCLAMIVGAILIAYYALKLVGRVIDTFINWVSTVTSTLDAVVIVYIGNKHPSGFLWSLPLDLDRGYYRMSRDREGSYLFLGILSRFRLTVDRYAHVIDYLFAVGCGYIRREIFKRSLARLEEVGCRFAVDRSVGYFYEILASDITLGNPIENYIRFFRVVYESRADELFARGGVFRGVEPCVEILKHAVSLGALPDGHPYFFINALRRHSLGRYPGGASVYVYLLSVLGKGLDGNIYGLSLIIGIRDRGLCL